MNPDDRRAAAQLVRRLLASQSTEATIAEVWQLIESADPFPTALALELVTLEGPDRLRTVLEELPTPEVVDFSTLTRKVLANEPVRRPAATRFLRASAVAVDLSALLWDQTRFLPAEEYDAPGSDVQAFLDSPLFEVEDQVRERIAGLRFSSEAQRARTLGAERLTAFQTYALRHGKLDIIDPQSGLPAAYLGYYMRYDKVVYRFRGEGDLLLVTGGSAGQIRGVYLPGDDLFLDLAHSFAMDLRTWPTTKADLARAILRNKRRSGGSDVPTPSGAADVTVRIGGVENFAHRVWNAMGALDREAMAGTLTGVERAVTIGSEFFGPLRDLYPELAGAEIEARPRGGVDRGDVADPTQLLVPLGTTVVMAESCGRVVEAAERTVDQPAAAAMLARATTYRHRVYVALRVGDKSWADATTELPRLIDQVLARYPDTCFLLDGFSVPSGVDHISDRWLPQLEALRTMMATVRERVADPDRVIDMLGLDLLSSIAVLRRATCYLTPIGTAHHKVDWFSDLPGVLYVSEEFAGMPHDLWPGLRQPLNARAPTIVVGTDEGPESVRRRRSTDARPGLANFTLSAEQVWAALEPLLDD
ncbi:MAG: hypothetical protein ABWZ91_13845 [Nocardioides sp.]